MPTKDREVRYVGSATADSWTNAIAQFAGHYCSSIEGGLSDEMCFRLDGVAQAIRSRTVDGDGTLFLLGNGGSHAICQTLRCAIMHGSSGSQRVSRVRIPETPHAFAACYPNLDYENWFGRYLQVESRSTDDTVILITGSGESRNIRIAAAVAAERGLKVIAFAGRSGGSLAGDLQDNKSAMLFPIHSADQQVAEDITQAFGWHLAKAVAADGNLSDPAQRAIRFREDYGRALNRVATLIAPFLSRLSESIADTILAGKNVFVCGLENGPHLFTAEHVAHNLGWDVAYNLPSSLNPHVYSTPTGCDFTGITNDRAYIAPSIERMLRKAKAGDTVLVFGPDRASETFAACERIASGVPRMFAIFDRADVQEGESVFSLDCHDPFLGANVAQVVGHMLGRAVNCRARNTVSGVPSLRFDDLFKALRDDDLAQLRRKGTATATSDYDAK